MPFPDETDEVQPTEVCVLLSLVDLIYTSTDKAFIWPFTAIKYSTAMGAFSQIKNPYGRLLLECMV